MMAEGGQALSGDPQREEPVNEDVGDPEAGEGAGSNPIEFLPISMEYLSIEYDPTLLQRSDTGESMKPDVYTDV